LHCLIFEFMQIAYAIENKFYVILQVRTSENCIFISYYIINYLDKHIIIYKNCKNCLHKLKNNLIQTGQKITNKIA
jgi:hypothetical protein